MPDLFEHALRLPPWDPCGALVTCGSLCRSAVHYLSVLAQFQVTENPRYKPSTTDGGVPVTYCNIYCWDVTRAMSCEIPHWIRGRETTANDLANWLVNEGSSTYGWRQVGPEEARIAANIGNPTVASWRNPGTGPGHIAMVVPESNHELAISQAGASNFTVGHVTKGFGMNRPTYWSHD